MDSQGGQRLKNSDIISNLPENIIEEILSKLPLQYAVRTSILSRSWRYKWTTVPDLVLDFGSGTGDEVSHGKFIYRILNQHNGPVHKFSLFVRRSVVTMRSYPDIDQWINFSLRKGVREFALLFSGGSSYEIHSSLFSCANLRELFLCFCAIPLPPPTFKGFNHLTFLRLLRVSVSNDQGLRNLIAMCPNLIKLFLTRIAGLDGLNIDYAPKLETLSFLGNPNYIHLKNTPHLVNAKIDFTKLPDMNDNIWNCRDTYNLNFLSNLRGFQTELNFLKFLAQGCIRKLLPSTFKNMWLVSIHGLMFEDIDILSLVLGLITSSPNLTELIVKTSKTTDPVADQALKVVAEYLKIESRSIGCFMNLRYVEMENIVGVEPEIELIKLILDKSPLLEKLKITHDGTIPGYINRESHVLKELIRFPRASKIAEIIINKLNN